MASYTGEAGQVIKEQRDQLMALHAEVRKLKSALPPGDAQAVMAEFKVRPEGKTVGLNIPDSMRERLIYQQEKLSGKTYRQTVHTCIELGIRVLEGPNGQREMRAAKRQPSGTDMSSAPAA